MVTDFWVVTAIYDSIPTRLNMKLPKELTTVTRVSKIVALITFIVLVICAFLIGMQYQQLLDMTENQLINIQSTAVTQQKPVITPTPTKALLYSSTSSTAYANNLFHYSVKYPAQYKASETKYSTLFYFTTDPNALGAPGVPDFYVTVLTGKNNDDPEAYNRFSAKEVEQIFSLKIGENINTRAGSKDEEFWKYTRIVDTVVDGMNGITVENKKSFGGYGNDRRVLIKKNGFFYMVGTYYKTDKQFSTFQSILSTFRFTK